MKELLSDDLWERLSKRFPVHSRLRAAIAYVTAPHLLFGDGDVLVCDASDSAITGGMTSAALLQRFFKAGAELYSYEGLHAKVAVIDDFALLGSANMSSNAGVGTCEASLLTDDAQVVGLVLGFVEKVKEDATPVDAKFLRRISALPVTPRKEPTRGRKPRKTTKTDSRVWIVSTRDLSDRVAEAEAEPEALGMSAAKRKLRNSRYEARSLRWSGRSRFRSEAKVGDLVLEVSPCQDGKRKGFEMYPPAPILHRQEGRAGRWTRFFIEVPVSQPSYDWADVAADFAALGTAKISPKSTRELKPRELGILQLLE